MKKTNMSKNPNQCNRQNKTPESKTGDYDKLTKTQKTLAGVALGLVVFTGVSFFATKTGIGEEAVDNLKNRFENSQNVTENSYDDYFKAASGSPSIKFEFDKFKPDIANENILSYDNGIERKIIEERSLGYDEVIAIQEGASIRSAPVIGKDGESSTIVFANKNIVLEGVVEYMMYSTEDDYADRYFGFKAENLPDEILSMINYDEVDIYWIKAGEALIEKRATEGDSDFGQVDDLTSVAG
jgi:hypothetical protein